MFVATILEQIASHSISYHASPPSTFGWRININLASISRWMACSPLPATLHRSKKASEGKGKLWINIYLSLHRSENAFRPRKRQKKRELLRIKEASYVSSWISIAARATLSAAFLHQTFSDCMARRRLRITQSLTHRNMRKSYGLLLPVLFGLSRLRFVIRARVN